MHNTIHTNAHTKKEKKKKEKKSFMRHFAFEFYNFRQCNVYLHDTVAIFIQFSGSLYSMIIVFIFSHNYAKIFYFLDNMCLMSHIEDISNGKTWVKLVRRN